MAPIKKVTVQRMKKGGNFRSQVNLDKKSVAYGYNAMAGWLDTAGLALIRNRLAGALKEEFDYQLNLLIMTTPAFCEYLRRTYRTKYVEDALWPEADAFWAKAGLDSTHQWGLG